MTEEPLTPLMEAAASMRELYEAYVAVGFTPEQSMQVVMMIQQTAFLKANGDDE